MIGIPTKIVRNVIKFFEKAVLNRVKKSEERIFTSSFFYEKHLFFTISSFPHCHI